MLAPKDYNNKSENLNRTMLNCIGAGGGVSEPGLNRARSQTYLPLRYGGGLKILWRRPSWVQVPPPPPLVSPKEDYFFSMLIASLTTQFLISAKNRFIPFQKS